MHKVRKDWDNQSREQHHKANAKGISISQEDLDQTGALLSKEWEKIWVYGNRKDLEKCDARNGWVL